ncbi:MAG: hypothetical protein GF334_11465, partial [Candidatus Altiarchaeales archaeon]|nr:hypothetical protein [Candidatus Altiarchaeales archaeon]
MMESIPVSPETYPYLISGMAKRLLWVRQPKEFLNAAFRYDETLEEIYPSIVQAVEKEGLKKEWGNVYPLTHEGVGEAVSRLRYYGIKPAEIILSKDGYFALKDNFLSEKDTVNQVSYVEWLPPGYGVVVPENKSFLGSAIS